MSPQEEAMRNTTSTHLRVPAHSHGRHVVPKQRLTSFSTGCQGQWVHAERKRKTCLLTRCSSGKTRVVQVLLPQRGDRHRWLLPNPQRSQISLLTGSLSPSSSNAKILDSEQLAYIEAGTEEGLSLCPPSLALANRKYWQPFCFELEP